MYLSILLLLVGITNVAVAAQPTGSVSSTITHPATVAAALRAATPTPAFTTPGELRDSWAQGNLLCMVTPLTKAGQETTIKCLAEQTSTHLSLAPIYTGYVAPSVTYTPYVPNYTPAPSPYLAAHMFERDYLKK